MSVEKISTVLRKACEWSAEHPQMAWQEAIHRGRYADPMGRRIVDFCNDRFVGPYGDAMLFHDTPGARSIMLGLAAAIAESEGL